MKRRIISPLPPDQRPGFYPPRRLGVPGAALSMFWRLHRMQVQADYTHYQRRTARCLGGWISRSKCIHLRKTSLMVFAAISQSPGSIKETRPHFFTYIHMTFGHL